MCRCQYLWACEKALDCHRQSSGICYLHIFCAGHSSCPAYQACCQLDSGEPASQSQVTIASCNLVFTKLGRESSSGITNGVWRGRCLLPVMQYHWSTAFLVIGKVIVILVSGGALPDSKTFASKGSHANGKLWVQATSRIITERPLVLLMPCVPLIIYGGLALFWVWSTIYLFTSCTFLFFALLLVRSVSAITLPRSLAAYLFPAFYSAKFAFILAWRYCSSEPGGN